MKVQNNYILLRKEYIKKENREETDEKGRRIIHLDLPIGLRTLLNEIFNLKGENWNSDSHFKHTVSFEHTIENKKGTVTIEIFEVLNDCYLNIQVDNKTKIQCVKLLEYVNFELYNPENKIEQTFTMVTSYDAISEFYCNKIFVKFAHFERLFRRLLFNIYILNYGNDYYKKTISQDIIAKAKGNIRAKKQKDEQYLKEFFYSLDYGDLQNILFASKWTSVDEANKQNFLSKHDNLSELSDEELRKFIQGINAKSDWERLFKDKITRPDIEDDMEYIRKQRNKVAHSKLFTHDDYVDSLKTLNVLLKSVDKAIGLTQDKDFWEKNLTALTASLQIVKESFKEFSAQISKMFASIKISDMLAPFKQIASQIQSYYKPIRELGLYMSNNKNENLEEETDKNDDSDDKL